MNFFPRTILLATDGSRNATQAARVTAGLAKGSSAELHLVHAWHDVPTAHHHGPTEAESKLQGGKVLERQVGKLRAGGARIAGAHLKEGRPADAVLETTKEIQADMIVVGRRGLGKVGRLLLGSVSAEVLQSSSVPVLVVSEPRRSSPRPAKEEGEVETTKPSGFSTVLVATDGSALSFWASRHAINLARVLGAFLFIVNAVDVNMAFHNGIHFGEAMGELEHDAREATRGIASLARANGVRCAELIVAGQPHRAIVRAAEGTGADLIVLGSGSMSRLERSLIGSVSKAVVGRAETPVLVVGGNQLSVVGKQSDRDELSAIDG